MESFKVVIVLLITGTTETVQLKNDVYRKLLLLSWTIL